MLKTFAAFGLAAALVCAPVVAFAEDAAPAATDAPKTDTMKPMKPMKHKHHAKHAMHKKKMMAPKDDATPAADAPK